MSSARRRPQFGAVISLMVNSLIGQHRELSLHAKKLLDPISKVREKVIYKVTIRKTIYWVVALEGTHPIDIQKAIEVFENQSFDKMQLSYLRPQNIETILLEDTMQLAIEQEGNLVMMYDLAFTYPINSVVHCSG